MAFRVLFACVGNSARSQMAQAFARSLGGDRVEARSGGSKPLGYVLPEAIAVMREAGLDISGSPSQGFDEAWVRDQCDLVVTMGCGDDACPAFAGKPLVDWDLPDPKGKPLAEFRAVRDDIERRVRALLAERGIAAARVRPARVDDGPAIGALLHADGLEANFVVSEFKVVEQDGAVVACGRLKRLPDGGLELASVAVRKDLRGRGLGDQVTRALLAGADGPVHALALAPAFFARHGFRPIAVADLPASLQGKATGMCASTGFVAMARR